MRITLIFLSLLVSICAPAQHFRQHILFLASDSLHGRAPGTTDELRAATYIAKQFDSAKCRVVFQKFPFEKDSAINVLGFLDLGKDSTIIISAHYDHLGYGGRKSKEINRKGIHPGADDNASGVAMMIGLAKSLMPLNKGIAFARYGTYDTGHYNFLFAAYSAHEAGLYGSAYFADSKIGRSVKIRAVINFDMVGRLDTISKTLRISGAETDSVFAAYFLRQQDSSFHFRFDDTNILLSDLKSFSKAHIPVLNITSGIHDDYHRMSDTESKINYDGMQSIFNMLWDLLYRF